MAEAKKSPAKKAAKGKKAAPKKAAGKPAAAKKPPVRKAARNAAPKKPTARKAAPKKPTARKAAPKKTPAGKAPPKNPKAAGASAPAGNAGGNAGAGQEAPRYGFENVKPQIAAAAEAIESTVSDLIDKADVQDFPDKMWRLLAMVAFAFVGYWVFIAAVILAAMQWVVVLLGDKPSPEIAHYMERCSSYVRQVLDLLSYRSEALPWPLGPLPGEEVSEDAEA